MKKTLVALAAMASMSAFAQSSVTLYGVADIWLGNIKTSVGGTKTYVNSGGSTGNFMGSGGINGSRFGLKGSEDLGGGLKANFLFENGFNLDSGAAAQGGLLFGRQAYAGLSGGFGEVRFGRQYSAYDEARGGSDLMGHTAFSPTAGTANAWGNGRNYGFRIDNSWRYATPNFGGFTAAVTYGLGENKSSTGNAGGVFALHAAYNNGPISAFFAHQQEKTGSSGVPLNLLNGGVSFAPTATKETHTLLSGAYDLGVVKLRGAFNQSKDNAVAGPNADKEFAFGVAAPLGPVTLEAEFATSKNNQSKANAIGLQAKYNLSKRTFVYTGFNTGKQTTTPAGVGAVGVATKTQILAVGLRHGF